MTAHTSSRLRAINARASLSCLCALHASTSHDALDADKTTYCQALLSTLDTITGDQILFITSGIVEVATLG